MMIWGLLQVCLSMAIAISYLAVAVSVRREHPSSGWLLILAALIPLGASCVGGVLEPMYQSSLPYVAIWTVLGAARVAAGALLVVGLVRLARRVEELRGPSKF